MSSNANNTSSNNNQNRQRKEDRATSSSSSVAAAQLPTQIVTRRTRSTKKNETNHPSVKQSPSMSGPKNKTISIGTSYQVLVLPECDELKENIDADRDRDECLWSSKQTELDNNQIDRYCQAAAKNHGIDLERALYYLYKTGSDLNKLKAPACIMHKVAFSADDAFAFRNAHMYFGKNFAKIRQVLPHKTISALVEHYYLTKKQQNYKSFTDNDGVQSSETTDSDNDGHTQIKSELHQPICEVCRHDVRKLYTVNGLELCRTCKLYFKATNKHRVCAQPVEEIRRVPICPPEMKKIAEQFGEVARTAQKFEDPDGTGEVQVARRGDTVCEKQIHEVIKAQKKLQSNTKRLEASLQAKTVESKKYLGSVEEARKFLGNTTVNTQNQNQRTRCSYNWSNKEKEAAVHALIRFDCDHNIVSDILSTKTPNMVKAFYSKHEAELRKITGERQKKMEKIENNLATELKETTLTTDHEVIELD